VQDPEGPGPKELMIMSTRTHRDRPLALMAFLGSALLAGFWALYLTGRITMGEPGSVAAEFEAAFPVADGLIALLLLTAGVGLWRGHAGARFVMTAAASMVLYLGILDLTFYTRQGFFAELNAESALELALTLTCLAGGSFALARCWRHRRTS
jgi:hypothetical protein